MPKFLWNHSLEGKTKAKVAWKYVCQPKYEGGLGIRKIKDINTSLMANHIWCILNNTLWVDWIYSYKLKERNFWDVIPQANMSWGWRILLQIRSIIRPHIRSRLGNGNNTSMWFDNWHTSCPLSQYISPRAINGCGFRMHYTVSDMINNGIWKWPIAWYDLFPVLINIQPPSLTRDKKDELIWVDSNGKERKFSTTVVWDTIRVRGIEIDWVNLVWFPQAIPKHALTMWLIMKEKLKTQDRLKPWEVGGAPNLNLLCCLLCKHGPDSHNHLFFECSFSRQVWDLVKPLAGMQRVSHQWKDIVDWLISISKSASIKRAIGRLLVAATAYVIWQERNTRLFSNKERNAAQIKEIIVNTVPMKLTTTTVKCTAKDTSLLSDWHIPDVSKT